MKIKGKCLCGAVTYSVEKESPEAGICHCEMCRAWSGGVFIGFEAAPDATEITGEENITLYRSSDWAERGFCSKCGSSLFYRVTAPGPHQGVFHFGAGTLEDQDALNLTSEIFIDKKPAAYAFKGERQVMTAAEVFAQFAPKE